MSVAISSSSPNPFTVAADLLDPPVWEPQGRPDPLPHQTPPDGPWDLWLMLGGRGAGKTEGCGRYFAAYMRAHPGTRGRIIAPTFGDAVEACIRGPSGLVAIDPDVRWIPGADGGSRVVWPNSSEALVLGTPTPRDVDRLRAGGNRECFVAGTPVLSEDGWKPIERIAVGERVWTRQGLRRVKRAGLTGKRPTWNLTTVQGRQLIGTADHPIATADGWASLGSLAPGDMLHTWLQRSSGMGVAGISGRMATSGTAVTGCSTAPSTRTPSAPSLTGSSSTTSTTTRPTTGPRTSRPSPVRNTPSTTLSSTPRGSAPAWSATGSDGARGPSAAPAMSAAPSSSTSAWSPASAAPTASRPTTTAPRPAAPGNGASASSAAPASIPAGTCAPARDHVRASSPTGRVEPVYDLTVEGCPEFVAAGIVVHNCDWWEEIAANPQLEKAWDQAQLGLRLGRPHTIASTTPRNVKKLRELLDRDGTKVTRATSRDNPHLSAEWRAKLEAAYAGTRLARQEIEGELLTDVPGALWTPALLDLGRVKEAPDLARVVVAVDPSGGSSDGHDEQGIIVAGKGTDGHGYVLDDRTCRLSPDGWGRRAVQAYLDHQADAVLWEANFGGDMVEANIRAAARAMDVEVPTVKVTASRGKQLRAQPVAALYGNPDDLSGSAPRVHHVGDLGRLEDQQTMWTPESGESPDRLDALTMCLTDLMLGEQKAWGFV